MSVTVSITDTATPMLERIGKEVRDGRGLLAVLGRAGANRLRKHFRDKDAAEPNKMGGRREHFWNKVASSVFVKPPGAQSVAIGISHVAIRQKYLGGTITAKRTGWLTIPLIPDAYGRFSKTYERETGNKLFRVKSRKGNYLLAEKAEGGGIRVVYLLRKSVYQNATPHTLPDEESFSTAIVYAAQQFLEREKRRAATAKS